MHPVQENCPQASTRRQTGRVYRTALRLRGRTASALLLLGVLSSSLHAQDATAGSREATLPAATALVGPSTREVGLAVSSLKISKWKAPGPVKDDAQSNAASITRDLQSVLPPLLSQSDAAPRSVASAFAVYRNLDALYEVLLRVSATADLAAGDEESASLSHALNSLEATRRSLADSILTISHAQELALVQRRVAAAAPQSTAEPAQTTVVSDGPATPAAHRKPKPKASATTPPAKPSQD